MLLHLIKNIIQVKVLRVEKKINLKNVDLVIHKLNLCMD
jgi:hypothetical protein